MKAKLKNFGWTGWAMVGLGVLLIVGAAIAANISWSGADEEKTDEATAVDGSGHDVIDVSVTPPAEEDAPESLPQSGAVGQVEFVY